jgi:hypothetical protein
MSRLPRLTALLIVAASLVGTLASASHASEIYTGLLARGSGAIRCSFSNLGPTPIEVDILIRDSNNTPVSATSNLTLEGGESFTHSTTLPTEGRCVFTFTGSKNRVRGVICSAPGAAVACTTALPAS